jgi:aminoglycoside phosphotransferase (APT) family kinase protein
MPMRASSRATRAPRQKWAPRPKEPGLLEPYDLQRQLDVMKALEGSDVRAPRALWIETTREVLGRPFLVMERAEGEMYERNPVTPEMEAEPGRLRRMCEDMVDQLAAIHLVDLHPKPGNVRLQALRSASGGGSFGRRLASGAREPLRPFVHSSVCPFVRIDARSL